MAETEGQRIKREAVERRDATFAHYERLVYRRSERKCHWFVLLLMFGPMAVLGLVAVASVVGGR